MPIIVKEKICENLSVKQVNALNHLIDSVCNQQCKGHLVPEEVKDERLVDCSNCPFQAVYDALNPLQEEKNERNFNG